MFPFILTVVAQAAAEPAGAYFVADPIIIVTAGREPVSATLAGASVSLIDQKTISTLNLSSVTDVLRLTPGIAVAANGPLGAQVQMRLRGAEANHTLLVVDGMEINDPSTSAEGRFETLLSDSIERVEIIRGPQSALWGPEAIGGVINISTLSVKGNRLKASGEYGSHSHERLATYASLGGENGGMSLDANVLNNKGIDISGTNGDHDGLNHKEVGGKAIWSKDNYEAGVTARYIRSRNLFDDYDYLTSKLVDGDLSTMHRWVGVRGFGNVTLLDDRWVHRVEASIFDSASLNLKDKSFESRNDGRRTHFGYQNSIMLDTGAFSNRLTTAFETEKFDFHADDSSSGGLTRQYAERKRDSLIAEFRSEYEQRGMLALSVRRDMNNVFADTTTLRAATSWLFDNGIKLHASYGEGVADPTFTELFGYFPDMFQGNPNLTPERARGYELGLGYRLGGLSTELSWYHHRLTSEIVGTYDYATNISSVGNANGTSKRKGIEASLRWSPLDTLTLDANYSWNKADEQTVADQIAVREVRRPKHSANISAIMQVDKWKLGSSLAWVGKRIDNDFSTWPATPVVMKDYSLVSVSASYALLENMAVTARVENALNSQYQDVLGYNTMGRTAYVGLKFAWGD